jgi:hypothetical protein
MKIDNTYNGWSNYATWRINLEIFDGFDISELSEMDTYDLSKYLEDFLNEYLECETERTNTLVMAYAMAFIANVNFYEIAEHLQENMETTQ